MRSSGASLDAFDARIRQAAFDRVRQLTARHGLINRQQLAEGFRVDGQRWPLVNPQRGIFKPRELPYLLSIRTVVPGRGRRVWYDDQRRVHEAIYAGAELLEYAFMGADPKAADNRWLHEAYLRQTPVIYFLGVSPGHYQAILPTFILGWHPERLCVRIGFGDSSQVSATAPAPQAPERRYALREVKQRLHQAAFREQVLTAYQGRCAISNLPEVHLVDAAHIIADTDDLLGQPIVTNGIALSKLHHAAFDQHFIGIDPDYRVHVAERLLDLHDGPLLDALKGVAGQRLQPPRRREDWPDRERLARRFEQFQQTAGPIP